MILKNIRINNIKTKLIALILITLIPITVLQVIVININYKASVDRKIGSSEDFAKIFSSSIMNYFRDIWHTESALGLSIISNNSWNENDIYHFLNQVKASNVGVSQFLWLSPSGDVIATTDSSYKNKSLAQRDYIMQIMDGKENVVSDLLQSTDSGNIFIAVARGIRNDKGLVGIVIGLVQEKQIESILTIKRECTSSSYGLVDRNGVIVYRYGTSGIPFENRKIKNDSPTWKALQGQTVKSYNYNSSYDGNARTGINYPIEQIGWACYVSDSTSELLKPFSSQMRNSIISLAIVFLLSFLIATLIGTHFITSINKILETTKEVIQGNLTARVNLTGNDEIAVIGRALDDMTLKVSEKVKEVEEYSNLKAQFLTTMSHELKTPLNIILGCVQLIERLDNTDRTAYSNSIHKYNKMLRQNSYRLLRLINNIIDINKIESKSIEICDSNGNIVEAIENITLSVTEYAKLKHISLIFDTEVEEKVIAFDPDKVERIILNLLSNAIKFTEPGGAIEVNIFDRGETLIISVKDSGIGIPADKIHTIFERFAQVDNSLTRKSEGSGIGLSLVKSLVEMHGGTISVSSELGKGSEFLIELPARLTNNTSSTNNKMNITGVERVKIEFTDIYM